MKFRIFLVIGLMAAGGAPSGIAQGHAERGFLVSFANPPTGLVNVELPAGSRTPVSISGLAPTYEANRIVALAATPDNQLYALVEHPTLPDHLYLIDAETGAATFLAEMELTVAIVDFALDDGGQLWAVIDGDLYQIDTATGGRTLFLDVADRLTGIAFRNSSLYSTFSGMSGVTLVEIDPVSAALASISLINGVTPFTVVIALDFDEAGNLWVLSLWFAGLGVPEVGTELSRVPNVTSGEAIVYDEPQDAGAFALARGALVSNDIPALDTAGMVLLALVLLAGGIFVLQQDRELRRQPDRTP